MTEKRFTYDSKTVSILKDGEFWLDGNIDTACNHSEICKELNALYDENEQLKKIIEDNVDFKIIFSDRDLNDICNEMGYELSENEIKLQRLAKENEQLKEEIKDLNDILARYEEKELME